jgi:hypothetical protein
MDAIPFLKGFTVLKQYSVCEKRRKKNGKGLT